MLLRQIFAAGLALAVLLPAVTAQNTVDPAVRFMNLLPLPRTEWGVATVPFAQGEWQPGDRFEAEGVLSHLEPFGARWPDGSVRASGRR